MLSSLALGIAGTMAPVSFVLFARAATGSFGGASAVLAASTAGGLIFAPLRGRLVDRIGPSPAVLRLAVPSVATDVAFILAGTSDASALTLSVLAFVAGAITTPAGAALRNVLSDQFAAGETRHAGYAVMSVLQEASFITGPLLAGGLVAIGSPTAAVAVAAGLSLIGALTFATSPGARAQRPHQAERGRARALAGQGIRTVVATSAAFGLTFGALDIAFPAFARDHGSTAAAGVLLSALAVGIGVGGFLYGRRPVSSPLAHQYPALTLLASIGVLPLIAASSLPAMIVLAVASGMCFAPITICQIGSIDQLAPRGHTAEAFTWLTTLYGAGSALGAALAGQLIAHSSIRAAIILACATAFTAWLVTIARRASLKPTPLPAPDAG